MNTRDLMDFPLSAKREAARILAAFRDPDLDLTQYLKDTMAIEYNPVSKHTFAVDLDFNCALINKDGKLEDWYRCGLSAPHGECPNEGFLADFKVNAVGRACCQRYLDALRRKAS